MSNFNDVRNWITGEEPRGLSAAIKALPVETLPPKLNIGGQEALASQFSGPTEPGPKEVTARRGYHSPLGFNSAKQRGAIRGKAWAAAYTAYLHHTHINYTEGSSRWSGINDHRRAYRHEYPQFMDCSAFVTWCLWDATRAEKSGDFVNGAGWSGGYTGTMTQHGIDVNGGDLLMADVVFYGGSWSIPAHTAIYIGNGRVISHGMQGDPRIYPTNLFGALPIRRFKRYIR